MYTKNGVLKLLLRNSKAKRCPERWQDAPGFEITSFDVVLCFENRIFDICVEGNRTPHLHAVPINVLLYSELLSPLFCVIYYEDAQNREPEEFKPLHFVAMPVKDTPEEAEKAEQDVICLARMVCSWKKCSAFACVTWFHSFSLPYATSIVVSIYLTVGYLFFVSQLEEADDLEVDAARIVEKFEDETQRSLLHQVCHI